MNFVSTTEAKRSLEKYHQRSRRFKQELEDEGDEEVVDLGDIYTHAGYRVQVSSHRRPESYLLPCVTS